MVGFSGTPGECGQEEEDDYLGSCSGALIPGGAGGWAYALTCARWPPALVEGSSLSVPVA